ncbi:MAG: regulatory protein RecX [Lachnospiraceae bacterium]|nr:regulatory protein RecX [Lachnospiraceae bacterium]
MNDGSDMRRDGLNGENGIFRNADEKSFRIDRIEPVRGKTKRSWVRFDGAEDICLYNKEIRRLGLEDGQEMPGTLYGQVIREILVPRARKRALHLLEKQDRTRANLRDKLLEGGYPASVADDAIAYAESYHYIDDERYARNYVYFHKSSKSRRRMVMDLQRRGIDRGLADRVLAEDYDTDEDSLIHSLMEKRHYDPENADQKERSKMYRYLVSRGFDSNAVCEALRG